MNKENLEVNVYKWVSKCEDVIVKLPGFEDFVLHQCILDWSSRRRSHRGGWYSSGPGINIAMKLVAKDRGEIFKVYEYASYDSNKVIGGFYTNDTNHYTGLIVCHEMAHAAQFFYARKNNLGRLKPHGKEFKNIYSVLRKSLLNPLLPHQPSMLNNYTKFISGIVKETLLTLEEEKHLFGIN